MMAPGVFVILLGCGQFALWGRIEAAYVDLPSNLQANYRPWPFVALAPLDNAGIIDEIRHDPETQSTPTPIKIQVSFWATPAPVSDSPSDPAPTHNPAPLPGVAQMTKTPKRLTTLTHTPIVTRTVTLTLTATRTATPTWVLTLTRTTTPTTTTTSTPTLDPTATFQALPTATLNVSPLPPRPTSLPTAIPTAIPTQPPVVPSDTPVVPTDTLMPPSETPTP